MNKNQPYTTFEQIDRDLKRLQLQSQISKEELKLSFHQTKESITPSKLFGSVIGGIASSALIVKLLTPVAAFGIAKLMSSLDSDKPVIRKKSWYEELLSKLKINN